MTEAAPTGKRRYGGMEAHERLERRRTALVRAGLEVFGTVGYADSTIEALCGQAGLKNKRYFYESFPDREALLAAVYEAQIGPLKDRLLVALAEPGLTLEDQIKRGVSIFVRGLTADRRVARVVFLEALAAGEALRARQREVIHEIGEIVAGALAAHAGPDGNRRIRLGAVGLVGASAQMITDWAVGDDTLGTDEVIDVSVWLFTVAGERYSLDRRAD